MRTKAQLRFVYFRRKARIVFFTIGNTLRPITFSRSGLKLSPSFSTCCCRSTFSGSSCCCCFSKRRQRICCCCRRGIREIDIRYNIEAHKYAFLVILVNALQSLAQRRCNFNLSSVSSMATTTTGIKLPRAIFRNELDAKDTLSRFSLKDDHNTTMSISLRASKAPPNAHLTSRKVSENSFSFCPLTRSVQQAKSSCR